MYTVEDRSVSDPDWYPTHMRYVVSFQNENSGGRKVIIAEFLMMDDAQLFADFLNRKYKIVDD